MAAYKRGDDEAFRLLYEETVAQAKYIAQGIVKNIDDADDIVQDSYLSAIEKIEDLRNPSKFLPWFYQIVTNKAINYTLKMKPDLFKNRNEEQNALNKAFGDDGNETPQEIFEKGFVNNELFRIINSLPYEKGVTVLLYYYDGFSIAEIAEITGANKNLVRQRLWSARQEIKKELEKIEKKEDGKLFGLLLLPGSVSAKLFRSKLISSGSAVSSAGVKTAAGTVAVKSATGAGSAAAKIAAMTVTQKAVAAAVTVAVVGGASAGTAKIIKNRQTASPAESSVSDNSEEFTETSTRRKLSNIFSSATETAEHDPTENEQTSEDAVSNSQGTTRENTSGTTQAAVISDKETESETQKNPTAASKTTERTRRSENKSTSLTEKQTSSTTKRNTSTETEPSTQTTSKKQSETTATTSRPTTKGKATVRVTVVTNGGTTMIGTFTKTIDEGETYSFSDAEADARSRYGSQYDFTYAYTYGSDASSGAEAGKTYSITVDI